MTPRHVLCTIGVGLDFDVLSRVVDEAGGGEFELDELQREPDPRTREAFDTAVASRRITGVDGCASTTTTSTNGTSPSSSTGSART